MVVGIMWVPAMAFESVILEIPNLVVGKNVLDMVVDAMEMEMVVACVGMDMMDMGVGCNVPV